MNKQGRIGDFIASVTVLFGVIIVMLLFTAFSTGIFVTSVKDKLRASTTSEIKVNDVELLFEKITIDGNNMTVLQGLKDSWDDKIDDEKFKTTMRDLTPEGECVILAWKWAGSGAGDNVFGYVFSKKTDFKSDVINGDFRLDRSLEKYRDGDLLSEIPISFVDKIDDEFLLRDYDDIINYYAYRGECLHE